MVKIVLRTMVKTTRDDLMVKLRVRALIDLFSKYWSVLGIFPLKCCLCCPVLRA